MIPALVISAREAPSRDGIGVQGLVELRLAPEHLAQLHEGAVLQLVLSPDSAPAGATLVPPPNASAGVAGAESGGSVSPSTDMAELVQSFKRPESEDLAPFDAKLRELGADLGSVAAWCESLGRPRPSEMAPEQRESLLAALQTPKYFERYRAWRDGLRSCNSCGALVMWITTASGKPMPCDPALLRVSPRGRGATVTVACTDGVTRTMSLDPEGPYEGRISHFATCPNAKEHRKPKGGKP